jgi:hypothetical protein
MEVYLCHPSDFVFQLVAMTKYLDIKVIHKVRGDEG